MAGVKNSKRLTPKKFKLIKTLLEAGIPKSKVCNIVEKSYFTVMFAEKADTLKDYFRVTREARGETESQKVEKKLNKEIAPKVAKANDVAVVRQLQEIKQILIDTNTIFRRMETNSQGGRRLFGR